MAKEVEYTPLPIHRQDDEFVYMESMLYPSFYHDPNAEVISSALHRLYCADDKFCNTYEVSDTIDDVFEKLEHETSLTRDEIDKQLIIYAWGAKSIIEVIKTATV